MAEQGTLYFLGGDPGRVIDVFRKHGFSIEVTGAARNWRQIVLISGEAVLTLRLQTLPRDPAYFKRQLPLLAETIRNLPARSEPRRAALLKIVPAITGSIGLTAEPTFSANDGLASALTLAARATDGFFAIAAGFIDAESRPLLLNAGSFDPSSQLPRRVAVPSPQPVSLDDSFTDFHPPVASRVAERMYVMLAAAYRALIEKSNSPQLAAQQMQRLSKWLLGLQINEELESRERRALNTGLGKMTPGLIDELTESFDAIVVLGWALGLADLPAHDEAADPWKLSQTLGLFGDDTRFVIDSAELRDPHTLREAADRILAVHWRLNQFEKDNAALDMAGMAADAWFGDMDSGKLALIDNDLAIVGRPLALTAESDRDRVREITLQRHRAINWLLGHHRLFSRVETAT